LYEVQLKFNLYSIRVYVYMSIYVEREKEREREFYAYSLLYAVFLYRMLRMFVKT